MDEAVDQPSAGASSLMAELRKATSELHDQIDSDPRMAKYMQSKEGLARLLGRWYGFLQPYELALSKKLDAERWNSFLSERRKSQLIVRDLNTFGIAVEGLPLCHALPDLECEVQVWGSMYVTEGSTLGGRYIARQIERTLGLTNNHGYAFFNCYGDDTQLRWKEFGRLVERECTSNREEAVKSAVETFKTINRWLVADA